MESNTKILNHIIQLCFNAKEYKLLNEQIVLLSKKHGLLKTVKLLPNEFINIIYLRL